MVPLKSREEEWRGNSFKGGETQKPREKEVTVHIQSERVKKKKKKTTPEEINKEAPGCETKVTPGRQNRGMKIQLS